MKITESTIPSNVVLTGRYYHVSYEKSKFKIFEHNSIILISGTIYLLKGTDYNTVRQYSNEALFDNKDEAEKYIVQQAKKVEKKKADDAKRAELLSNAFYTYSLADFKKALKKRYQPKTISNFCKELLEDKWSLSRAKNIAIDALKKGVICYSYNGKDEYLRIDSVTRMEKSANDKTITVKLFSGDTPILQTVDRELGLELELIFSNRPAIEINND